MQNKQIRARKYAMQRSSRPDDLSRHNGRGGSLTGFTLIELIVVISIIVLMTSISMVFVSKFIKSENLKHGGLILRTTFMKVRQLAATQRIMHFLVFEPNTSSMTIYKDINGNQTWDKNTDEQVDETIGLPEGISFLSGHDGPPLFNLPEPYLYLGFRTDASLMMPTGISDQSLVHPPKIKETDIVLKQKNQPKTKMYIDFERGTAKIRVLLLYTEK